jgi:tRNA threonylcarbamoyl adenosine modification protein YeaZ
LPVQAPRSERDLVLCIETSNPSAAEGPPSESVSLARIQGGRARVLAAGSLRPELRHDDDLVPAIDRVFRAAGVQPSEVGLVAVSAGPGGFTGLRVAMSAAVMIAEAIGARVLGVETARVAAAGWHGNDASAAGGVLLVLLASKNERTHATLVRTGDAFEIAETLGMVDAARVGEALDGAELVGVIGDRFVPESIRSLCGARGFEVVPPRLDAGGVLAVACAEAARANDWGSVGDDPARARVVYAREPEAVTKWRELHPRRG